MTTQTIINDIREFLSNATASEVSALKKTILATLKIDHGPNKTEIIRELFMTGRRFTIQELADEAGCTPKSVSSYMTALRHDTTAPLDIMTDGQGRKFIIVD